MKPDKQHTKAEKSRQVAFEKISKENFELHEVVERSTAELEQKNRELEIEASLEKIRTAAMTMKEPAAMLEICKTISQQLRLLGVNGIRNVQTAIFYESRGTYMNYEYYAKHRKTIVTETSYTDHKVPKAFAKKMLRGRGEIFITHIKGQKVKEWIAYQKTTNVFIDRFLEKAASLNYYWYSLGPVALGMSTYMPLSKDDLNLFNRFRNVFELAYRRFVDIEKAEAQARESQIQLALEKVRARTMAMQKSDELLEASLELFQQLKGLGEPAEQLTIGVIKEEENIAEVSVTLKGSKLLQTHRHDLGEPYVMSKILKAWKAKQKTLVLKQDWKELKAYNKYRNKLVQSDMFPLDQKPGDQRLLYVAFYSKGALALSSNEPRPEGTLQLLERFAKVFDQTYTRFLDLQKAEAQAREAKIEAALERTRTQSMIMQHSNELDDTLRVFHEQVLLLGINSAFSFLWLPDEEKNRHIFWAAWAENNSTVFKSKAINYLLDRNEPATAQCLVDWKGNESIVSYHVPSSGVKNYFAAWQELIDGVEQLKPEYFSGGLYYVEAFMKYGCFGVMVATDLMEDEKKILGRFAIEFERTYRRFLDLQKAEAQAREAKIEAALERVRSRSLAMHKSGEIIEVVRAVFEKLNELNVELNTAFIIIFKEHSRDTDWWLINKDKGEFSNILVRYAGISILKEMFETKEQGKEIFSSTYHGEEKNELFRYLFTETDFKYAPPERQKYIFDNEAISISMAMTNKIAIQITRHNERAFSEADNEILKRFTKVFDQSYTRFLDLQKAEAQAEQARLNLIQIQAEKQRAEDALTELQATQKQLVQSEKMASLGELTAGIAHEIQNPLNFVNNFSEVSNELIDEMKEEMDKGNYGEAKQIADDVKQNLEKINHHGKRADSIVKGMLQHSRSSGGQKELTDINALCDEYLRLSYHGLRVKDKAFYAKIEASFDESIGRIEIMPQEIGRVILNLINNAFYEVNKKKVALGDAAYNPAVRVTTKKINNKIEIQVADNANGIPAAIKEKIFQPFFTTKPTGQGTGLGLSLSYDIVKAHGGEIKIETKEGEGTTFIIKIPVK